MSAGWMARAGATDLRLAEEYAKLKRDARRKGFSIRHERDGDKWTARLDGVMKGRIVVARKGAVVFEAGYLRDLWGRGWAREATGDQEVGHLLWLLKRKLESM